MRPIDADALQKLFSEVSTGLLGKAPFDKDIEHQVRAFLMTAEMIADAPTIDAVPCKELHALIGEIYYNDGLTMRSLKKLNGMLAKYDSAKR